MTQGTVRNWLGMLIVFSHFLLLTLVLTSPVFLGAKWNEALGFAEVIGPLFAGFTTAIVRYFVRHPTAGPPGPQVTAPYVVISFLPTCILTFLIGFFFVAFVRNYLGQVTLEQARTATAGLEALFGIYVGYVLEDLFQYRRETPLDGTAGTPATPDGGKQT